MAVTGWTWRDGILWLGAFLVAVWVYLAVARAGATVPVVVARHDLQAYQKIQPSDLQVAPWPKAARHPSFFSEPGELWGRYLLQDVAAGQPLWPLHVGGLHQRSALAAAIPDGHVAFAIPLDDERWAPRLQAGDRVDLIFIYGKGGELSFARTLLQGLTVLQAGERSTVVALTPWDAERVAFALATGRVLVTLEGYGEPPDPSFGVDGHTLFFGGREEEADVP
ncbi:MAG: Flp pilus assembly protein CpaB [Clostridiales bacterium]|nr:Flp pilus assembly protein CpaB [Clostridiales bacterium]